MTFARNLSKRYEEQLWDTAAKAELDALQTASKKVVHKAAEAASEFIGNKVTEKIVKPNQNSRNVEEIIIPPEKREDILNKLGPVLKIWNIINYLNY